MERVAIVGSRRFEDLEAVREYIRELPKGTVIVSGGAPGVDQAAEQAARQCSLEVKVYKPDWDRYGKSAGFLRNQTIVDDCDRLVAFWDGWSRGTKDSMDKAKKAGKQVLTIT